MPVGLEPLKIVSLRLLDIFFLPYLCVLTPVRMQNPWLTTDSYIQDRAGLIESDESAQMIAYESCESVTI